MLQSSSLKWNVMWTKLAFMLVWNLKPSIYIHILELMTLFHLLCKCISESVVNMIYTLHSRSNKCLLFWCILQYQFFVLEILLGLTEHQFSSDKFWFHFQIWLFCSSCTALSCEQTSMQHFSGDLYLCIGSSSYVYKLIHVFPKAV